MTAGAAEGATYKRLPTLPTAWLLMRSRPTGFNGQVPARFLSKIMDLQSGAADGAATTTRPIDRGLFAGLAADAAQRRIARTVPKPVHIFHNSAVLERNRLTLNPQINYVSESQVSIKGVSE